MFSIMLVGFAVLMAAGVAWPLSILAERRRRKWRAIAAERRHRQEERIEAYLAGAR